MPEMTYLEAIRAAMHDEMEIDERVFVMGEDVGRQGGAFGATKELQQRFGELRSIDTPVAESGIVGVAVGAAMAGQRPMIASPSSSAGGVSATTAGLRIRRPSSKAWSTTARSRARSSGLKR